MNLSLRTLAVVLLIFPLGGFLMARNDRIVSNLIGLPTGNSRLVLAAMDGDSRGIADCLADGADPNSDDVTGFCALAWAARSGDIASVEALLAAGANPSVMCETGFTPLAVASGCGCVGTMRLLLAHGADPNLYSPHCGSALYQSILHESPDATQLLLEHGADPNLPAADGTTPLQLARSQPRSARIVQMLLAAGANDVKIASSSPAGAAADGS